MNLDDARRLGVPNTIARVAHGAWGLEMGEIVGEVGTRKLFENDRVIVWDYTWTPGQPTPMHFHDKDVVVVYMADGALKSTTPDGQNTVNEFSVGTVRFNLRDRVHSEVVSRGAGRAVITELK